MDLLLDTHTLIWFLNGDKQLSQKVRNEIENTNNKKVVSIASVWEIAIKTSLNKFNFPKGLKGIVELIHENNFEILPISINHTLLVSTLAFHHRDPFDRILVAQSQAESLTIATKDDNIKQYDVKTIW
jgi:PIN domain nuclease of toxin-antitoxin system